MFAIIIFANTCKRGLSRSSPSTPKTRLLTHSQKLWHKMTSSVIVAICAVRNLSKPPKLIEADKAKADEAEDADEAIVADKAEAEEVIVTNEAVVADEANSASVAKASELDELDEANASNKVNEANKVHEPRSRQGGKPTRLVMPRLQGQFAR
jgi:hypothetical protein